MISRRLIQDNYDIVDLCNNFRASTESPVGRAIEQCHQEISFDAGDLLGVPYSCNDLTLPGRSRDNVLADP